MSFASFDSVIILVYLYCQFSQLLFILKAIKYFCVQNNINETASHFVNGFFQIHEQESFKCIIWIYQDVILAC